MQVLTFSSFSEQTMADGVKEKLMESIAPRMESPHAKITVVGVGEVGMACAFSVVLQVRAMF